VVAVDRRLELLKLEGLGFSQPEIVKELSRNFHCSERTVYHDFEGRERWQPELQHVENHSRILMKIVDRYEQIYRQASIKLLTGSQEATQLGALNIMLKANLLVFETAVLPEILHRLKTLEEKARRGVFVP
jgi:transcriptional antiterminator